MLTTEYPSAERSYFPDTVTRLIDDERRRHFGHERGHFESRHALILTVGRRSDADPA